MHEKVLREAQENFEKELKKLGGGTRCQGSIRREGEVVENVGSEATISQSPGIPLQPGHARGVDTAHVEGGRTVTKIGQGTPSSSMTEALRNLDLPALPGANVEGSSSLFGDWLTMAFPLMADISNSAKAWWEGSLMVARGRYSRWLTMSPLERLRAKPEVAVDPALQRIGQRAEATLLGALPDQLCRDLVSGRHLTVVNILYKLHVTYQPGGGAEKTQLLKNLVETKFSTQTSELLTQVRLWRRWQSRAQELHLALPDPIVLMVHSKFALYSGAQLLKFVAKAEASLEDMLPSKITITSSRKPP